MASEQKIELVAAPIFSPLLLLLRLLSLTSQAPLLGSLGWLGWPTFARSRCHGKNKTAKLVRAIRNVSPLVSKAFAADYQMTFFIDAPGVCGEKSLSNIFRQACGSRNIPMQSNLAVDLIDILSTRPAAARKRKRKLFQRNRNSVIDF